MRNDDEFTFHPFVCRLSAGTSDRWFETFIRCWRLPSSFLTERPSPWVSKCSLNLVPFLVVLHSHGRFMLVPRQDELQQQLRQEKRSHGGMAAGLTFRLTVDPQNILEMWKWKFVLFGTLMCLFKKRYMKVEESPKKGAKSNKTSWIIISD